MNERNTNAGTAGDKTSVKPGAAAKKVPAARGGAVLLPGKEEKRAQKEAAPGTQEKAKAAGTPAGKKSSGAAKKKAASGTKKNPPGPAQAAETAEPPAAAAKEKPGETRQKERAEPMENQQAIRPDEKHSEPVTVEAGHNDIPVGAALTEQESPLRVLFLASECAPFVKTGGLADVIGALPNTLARSGADIRVMLPLYSAIGDQYRKDMRRIKEFRVPMGWRSQYCGILEMKRGSVIYYFVDNEYYFGRGYIYGKTCNDEGERFAFFSKAALDAMPQIGFFPDVLHCHDWQAAMAIVLLRMQYGRLPEYRAVRTMYTIHNLRYQGVFDWSFMDELLSIGGEHFTGETFEYYGKVNFMKGAINYADVITTVSPTYAGEIQCPQYGETLDGVLRNRSGNLFGIMNGIDESLCDPSADANIPFAYSLEDLSGKGRCKEALRTEFWLDKDDSPIIGIVTRLTGQKGLDLVENAITGLMEKGVQLAVLGSGDVRYEHLFSWASWRYGGRIAARLSYNPGIASRIYAGADMFLMPSQFEPCGLAQMMALRYGTLPIVRETGGLKDSITPYNKFTGEGLGFTFRNYDHVDMLGAVDRALEAYYRPDCWNRLIRNAMSAHFTWDVSAQRYMELYHRILTR